MTSVAWCVGWLFYLLVALIGAGLIDWRSSKGSRTWLAVWMAGGALALALMARTLALSARPGLIHLPPPWPELVLRSVPLGSLWSAVAALLFLMTVLITLSAPRQRRILYALLPLQAGIGIYLWSGDGLLLLLSWEFISAVSYLGIITTRRSRIVWNAGWALLALSELGGMALLVALVWLLGGHGIGLNDGFSQMAVQVSHLSAAAKTTIMLLVLLAFGVKAGLFPVLIWMPMAEPQAPGVVAGIFSGLLTALAISGILAVDQVVHAGLVWAIIVLLLGVLGAVTSALYGILSRHVKQILAYSTLEVLGLVFSALGLWSLESIVSPHNVAATMALDAAVILLVVHAGAKFVLFSATDYSERFGHTLDRLGGLVHKAPWLSLFTLGGVLALAGIPPLGGFVGEWLLLEAIIKPLGVGRAQEPVHLALLVAGAILALTTALGATLYLRWFAFIFLGRLHQTDREPLTGDPGVWMRMGLALPWVLPILGGPGVVWFLPWANRVLVSFISTPKIVIAPSFVNINSALGLSKLGINLVPAPGAQGTVFYPQAFLVGDPYVLLLMGVLLGGAVALFRRWARRRTRVRYVMPWTGGAEPFSARTSYTAEGFVHPLRLAFQRFYGLKRNRHDTEGGRFYRHTIVYRVEETFYRPILSAGAWAAGSLRKIQSGQLTQYLAYLWIFLIVGLLVALLAKG